MALSESGGLKLQKESIDVTAVARDVVLAYGGDAQARGVRLEIDAPDDLPPIDADAVRIREVIGNLLSNALRHTPTGGSVVVRVAAGAGGGVYVDVRDTGAVCRRRRSRARSIGSTRARNRGARDSA